jgi:RNA polymerase sigma-32 factor
MQSVAQIRNPGAGLSALNAAVVLGPMAHDPRNDRSLALDDGALAPSRKPARGKRRADHVRADDDEKSSSMKRYMRDVRRHAVMSREEEHEVAARYVETADERLAARLVNANLRLVLKIALEYRVRRTNITDLIQEGNLGLIHAVRKYDPHRNVKLATYAAWWIRAYMLKFMLSNARLVKIGTTRAQRKLFFSLRRTRARLEGSTGVEVAAGQLAASLSVSERDVVEMEKRLGSSEASLDSAAHPHDDRNRLETLVAEEPGADDRLEQADLIAAVRRELEEFGRTLSGRDAQLFRERLYCTEKPKRLVAFATAFGVSRERVRQIELRLRERVREHLEATLGPGVCSVTA